MAFCGSLFYHTRWGSKGISGELVGNFTGISGISGDEWEISGDSWGLAGLQSTVSNRMDLVDWMQSTGSSRLDAVD